MKIYADENVERSIVEGLRRRKIEVVSARELGYLSKPDEFHIYLASLTLTGYNIFNQL